MLKSSKLYILRAMESSSVNSVPYCFLSSISSSFGSLLFFLKFIFGTEGRLKLLYLPFLCSGSSSCCSFSFSSFLDSSSFSSILTFELIGFFARFIAFDTFLFLRQQTNHRIVAMRANQMRPMAKTEARWVIMKEFLFLCF